METHKKQWEFLKKKFETGQLSHAYLFSGQEGIGKKDFAKELVKFINCLSVQSQQAEDDENKSTEACQKCVSGKLIEKENFPDLLVIESSQSDSSIKNEKDMMEIDVGQMRKANTFLSYKSYYGGYKTVIIENAERMNTDAADCFLKTLEEPKGKTIIMLISSKPEMLLPTIFSRCQTIKFFPVEKYKASTEEQKILQELLSVISGDLAIKFQYAKQVNLQGDNFNKILKILQRYFRNIMLAKIGVIKEPIQPQFINYPISKIKKIIRLIETLHTQILITNASPKLALEILLLEI